MGWLTNILYKVNPNSSAQSESFGARFLHNILLSSYYINTNTLLPKLLSISPFLPGQLQEVRHTISIQFSLCTQHLELLTNSGCLVGQVLADHCSLLQHGRKYLHLCQHGYHRIDHLASSTQSNVATIALCEYFYIKSSGAPVY